MYMYVCTSVCLLGARISQKPAVEISCLPESPGIVIVQFPGFKSHENGFGPGLCRAMMRTQ